MDGERDFIEEWRTPGKLLGAAGIICILWVAAGMFERKPKAVEHTIQDNQDENTLADTANETDAWGRSLDELE